MRGATVALALVLAGSACTRARPGAGAKLTDASRNLQGQVEFDHRCPPDKVRFIRIDEPGVTFDLDVCGVVRRYRAFGTGQPGDNVTLLDVTSLYPATSLPPPLPPMP